MLIKPVYCHNITPFFTYVILHGIQKSNWQSVQLSSLFLGEFNKQIRERRTFMNKLYQLAKGYNARYPNGNEPLRY